MSTLNCFEWAQIGGKKGLVGFRMSGFRWFLMSMSSWEKGGGLVAFWMGGLRWVVFDGWSLMGGLRWVVLDGWS